MPPADSNASLDERLDRLNQLVDKISQESKRRNLVDEQTNLQHERLIRLEQTTIASTRRQQQQQRVSPSPGGGVGGGSGLNVSTSDWGSSTSTSSTTAATAAALKRSTSELLSAEGEVSSLKTLVSRIGNIADAMVFKLWPERGRPPSQQQQHQQDVSRAVEEQIRRLQLAVDDVLAERARREGSAANLTKILQEKDRHLEGMNGRLNDAQRAVERAEGEARVLREQYGSKDEVDRMMQQLKYEISERDKEISRLKTQVANSAQALKSFKRSSGSVGADTREAEIRRLHEILRFNNISLETGRPRGPLPSNPNSNANASNQQQQQQQNNTNSSSSASSSTSSQAIIGPNGTPINAREYGMLIQRLETAEAACRAMREEAKKEVLPVSLKNLRMTHLLGSGSFADVNEGLWEVRCAVKRLKDSVQTNAYEVQKFHREAQMLRSLRHPGILRLMGFSEADFILVTEIMTGGSLHELIHNGPKLELKRVLSIAVEIAEILRFLHYCNIVHRDVKPENLMIDSSGRLRLCDFGLAAEKRGKYVSTRSNLAGTPRYMAPESYRDEPCTEKIDVYSFGMIVWEMFTRQLPWAGRNFSEVRAVVSAGTERPPMPRDIKPDLGRFIEDCWAHEPERRPSASDAIARLVAMGAQPQIYDADDDFHVEAC